MVCCSGVPSSGPGWALGCTWKRTGCRCPTGEKGSGEPSTISQASREMEPWVNREQSRVRVSYSPPSPQMLQPYCLQGGV